MNHLPEPGAELPFEGARSFRELGGYLSMDGVDPEIALPAADPPRPERRRRGLSGSRLRAGRFPAGPASQPLSGISPAAQKRPGFRPPST